MTSQTGYVDSTGRLRLTLLSIAAVLGPALFVIAACFEPTGDTDGAKETIATVADSTGRWYAAYALTGVGSALTLALAVLAPRLTPTRGSMVTTIGAALLAIGAVAFFAGIYVYGAVLSTLVEDGSRDVAVQAQDTLDDSWRIGVLFVVGFLGQLLGMLLLAIGYWRARTVAIWIPIALVAAAVAAFFLGGEGGVLAGISWLPFVAAAAGVVMALHRHPAALRDAPATA